MTKARGIRVAHNYNSMLSEHRCRQCGEKFIVRCAKEDYVYRRGTAVFCRYSCMRAYDRAHPPKAPRLIGERAVTA